MQLTVSSLSMIFKSYSAVIFMSSQSTTIMPADTPSIYQCSFVSGDYYAFKIEYLSEKWDIYVANRS